MHSTPVWRSGTEWMLFNLLFHVLRLLGTPTTRVRYEDVVGDPSGAIRRLSWRKSGTHAGQLNFIRGHEVTLAVDHMRPGIRCDSDTEHSRSHVTRPGDTPWDLVRGVSKSMLTWPLLKAYGYVGSRIR